jgi:hypothetical protein
MPVCGCTGALTRPYLLPWRWGSLGPETVTDLEKRAEARGWTVTRHLADNDIGSDTILLRETGTGVPGMPCVTGSKEWHSG